MARTADLIGFVDRNPTGLFANGRFRLNRGVASVPSGDSPDGTGEPPVLPAARGVGLGQVFFS